MSNVTPAKAKSRSRETLAPLKLRPAQFSVLVLIAANPNVPQSNISAALGIQRPNFVAMLDDPDPCA